MGLDQELTTPRDRGDLGANDEISAAIAALWREHREEALARVAVLEDLVSELATGSVSSESRDVARAAAHKLRGAAGTYGFPRASGIAGELEDLLAGGAALDIDRVPELSRSVLVLREDLEGDPQPPGAPAEGTSPDATASSAGVVLVSSDISYAQPLVAAARRAGMGLVVAGPADATDRIDEHRPRLVAVDLAGSGIRALSLLGEIAARPHAPPTFVVARAGGLVDRVEAVRRGAEGFFDRDLEPDGMIAAIERFAETLVHQGERVLAVDDDPSMLAAIGAILERHGYDVATLDDPGRFWEELERHSPDLVLLDLDMPQINGLELTAAVRSDPRWTGLPLLILTAYREPEVVRRAFVAGADDHLSKPIVEEELLARVRNRLDRAAAQRRTAERDPLTGALTRPAFVATLGRRLNLAAAAGEPLAVALFDLDATAALNRRAGSAAADAWLRRVTDGLCEEFGSARIGRWDGDSLMALLPGQGGAEAARRAAAVLARLGASAGPSISNGNGSAGSPTTVSAGIAESAAALEDTRGPDDLVVAAEQALADAKRQGGGRVSAGEGHDGAAEQVDVVIVEDDDSVVDVLRLALDDEGLASRRLADGAEAVGSLTGERPALGARVVLLDWDLPGLDGLSVLRALRDAGVLASTRVIMLTARATEAETLSALDLGASDYVAKPFSVPVLVERLRKALS